MKRKRGESARGTLESKTGRERKAGGKNVWARVCGRLRKKRERKSEDERVCERRERERANERERVRTRVRKQERRHKSIVVHGDTHTYTNHTRANTRNYIQVHTRDIYETQEHAILYIYDSIDDGAAHSHSVSRIVPQNFSFEFASRNLLFSNV